MSASEHFMPIIPRHRRLLEELRLQKTKDMLGGIGWGALKGEDEPFTYEELFLPLMQRGLIEDLTETELGSAGKYFVRITPIGERCLGLGVMLKYPRPTSDLELDKILAPPPSTPSDDEIIPAGAHA